MLFLLTFLQINIKEFSKGIIAVPSPTKKRMFDLKYVNKANRRMLKAKGLSKKSLSLNNQSIQSLSNSVTEDLKVSVSGLVNVTQHDYGFIVHLKDVEGATNDTQDIFTPNIPQPYVCNSQFTDVPILPHRRVFDIWGTVLCIFISCLLTFGTTAAYPLLFSMDKKLDKILIALGVKKDEEEQENELETINEVTKNTGIRDFLRKKRELEKSAKCMSNEQIYMLIALLVSVFTGILSANTFLVELDWPRIMKLEPTGNCYAIGNYQDLFVTKNYTKEQKNAIVGPIKAQLKANRMQRAIQKKANTLGMNDLETYSLLQHFSANQFSEKNQVDNKIRILSTKNRNLNSFFSDIELFADNEEAMEYESMTSQKEGYKKVHFRTRCGVSIKSFTPTAVTYTYNTKLRIMREPIKVSFIDEVHFLKSAYCKVGQSSGIPREAWSAGFTPMRVESIETEWKVGCGIGGCFGCKRRGDFRVGYRWSTGNWEHVKADDKNIDSLIRSEIGKEPLNLSEANISWSAKTYSSLLEERNSKGWYENLTHTILPNVFTGSYENVTGSNIVFDTDETKIRDAVMNGIWWGKCPHANMQACIEKKANFDTKFTQPTNNTCTVDLYMDIPEAEAEFKWMEWAEPCQKVHASVLEGNTNIQISTEETHFCSVNITYYGGDQNMIVIAKNIPYINPGITGWSCIDAGNGWGKECGQDTITPVQPMEYASNFTTYINSTTFPAKNWEIPSLASILGIDEIMYAAYSIVSLIVVAILSIVVIKVVVPAIQKVISKRKIHKEAIRKANREIDEAEDEFEQQRV